MRHKESFGRWPGTILVATLFLLLIAHSSWGVPNDAPYIEDELLVQHKVGGTEEDLSKILGDQGASTVEEIPQIRVKRIKVPPQALEKVKAALAHNPHINFVENNYLAESSALPNDFNYPSQWHLPIISAPQAWDISTGSSSVPIAIIDSGVDPAHPDLAAKLIPGYSFLSGSADTHDVLGHGTAVAGTAAAIGNNAQGVAGLAWVNPIMPLVVLDSTNYASYANIASAITYAADRGVRVMNISIGGSSSSTTLQNAVNYAWNKGAIIFASAMNNASSVPYYPAACSNVVAVSATTSSDTLAGFSSYGTWVDISAPGESILTTSNGGGYGYHSGTSFASPLSAGLAALVLSVSPSLTNAQVVNIIEQNADDLGTVGYDQYFGFGRINANRTLLAAKGSVPQPDTTPPSASMTAPAGGSTVSGSVTVNVSATDNVGVAKVELYINGAFFGSDPTGPYSFLWDTTKYSNGTYTLTAYAYDPSGNKSQPAALTLYVNNVAPSPAPSDTVAPTVSITSPASGSSVSSSPFGRKVQISVQASDNVGVTKIELYIDGSLVSVVSPGTSLTYTWNTTKASRGTHVIAAKAYDAAGNIGTTSVTTTK